MIRILHLAAYFSIALYAGYFFMFLLGLADPPNSVLIGREDELGVAESLLIFMMPWLSAWGLYMHDKFDFVTMSDGSSALSRFIWLCLVATYTATLIWLYYVEIVSNNGVETALLVSMLGQIKGSP